MAIGPINGFYVYDQETGTSGIAQVAASAISEGAIEEAVENYMEQHPEATLADGAVTTAKIANGAVTTGKIADDAVTYSELAPSAVRTAIIQDSAVTNAKINNGAVSEEKLSAAVQTKLNAASGAASVFIANYENNNGTLTRRFNKQDLLDAYQGGLVCFAYVDDDGEGTSWVLPLVTVDLSATSKTVDFQAQLINPDTNAIYYVRIDDATRPENATTGTTLTRFWVGNTE